MAFVFVEFLEDLVRPREKNFFRQIEAFVIIAEVLVLRHIRLLRLAVVVDATELDLHGWWENDRHVVRMREGRAITVKDLEYQGVVHNFDVGTEPLKISFEIDLRFINLQLYPRENVF